MKRRIFNLLSVISLLLCIVATAAWCRSFIRSDSLSQQHATYDAQERYAAWNWKIKMEDGGLGFEYFKEHNVHFQLERPLELKTEIINDAYPVFLTPFYVDYPYFICDPLDEKIKYRGIQLVIADETYDGEIYHYVQSTIPLLGVAAVFGFLPLIWLIRLRFRKHRVIAGRCWKCGYDLRASPDRCPECGTAVTIPTSTSKLH